MSTEVLAKLHELDNQWKAADKQRDEEIAKTGRAMGDTLEKLSRLEKATADTEQALQKRLDEIELKMDAPRFEGKDAKEQEKHLRAFEGWVRSVKVGDTQGDVEKRGALIEAQKAVSIGTTTAGGHALPEVINTQIDKKLLDISPMRGLVKVVKVGTSDYKELVDVRGSSGGWVGETGTRSETNTPMLQQVAPTFGICYAYPKATEESLQDIFFDVQSWLVNAAAEDFAQLEGAAIISGNGSNKPTGFLNGTINTINDDGASPERAFGALQYVPTGKAASLPNGPFDSPIRYTQSDFLITTVYKLKAQYRANARWLMNKNTLASIRKFKDVDGQYIWQRGITLGQPDTILGYPVAEMPDMPDVGSNTYPIAFGDFYAAYTLCDRVGTSITIDDNLTTPGYVKFYIRRRLGGILRNDDAIKVIKAAAS